MSCYTRHLSEVFVRAGVEDSRANRRRADGHIRCIVGKEGEDCPVVWIEVKSWLADPDRRDALATRLQKAFESEGRG